MFPINRLLMNVFNLEDGSIYLPSFFNNIHDVITYILKEIPFLKNKNSAFDLNKLHFNALSTII